MKYLKIKQAILYCLFSTYFISSSQTLNLVSDPSFEDTTTCLDNLTYFNFLNSWKNLDSTKYSALPFALFHSCASVWGLPSNNWFFQNPRSGNAVVEIGTLIPTSNPTTFQRTYTRNKLRSGLQNGKSYCAKMYVNAPDKQGDYYTDGIQMYFDNGQLDTIVAIDSIGPFTFVNPQVSNLSGNILNDTMNWVAVSGTFVANGTETFLTIGNFKSDANTDTLRTSFSTNATGGWSDILIDDVSVIDINASNWLHDTSIVLGDSVYIGLPKYEVPDALWYDINMNYIGKGSGIKVKPSQWATQYIQSIDVCSSIRYDTMTVWAAPLSISQYDNLRMSELEVYPNPSDGVFSILVNESIMNATLRIVNITGETILQREGLNGKRFTFDISGEAQGVYFAELITDSGIKRMKLVKE